MPVPLWMRRGKEAPKDTKPHLVQRIDGPVATYVCTTCEITVEEWDELHRPWRVRRV